MMNNKPMLMTDAQIERWKNLQNFNGEPYKIPDLPVTDITTWNTLIIPKLIECGAIPKKDLIIGKKYLGSCRNSDTAVWNGICFTYERCKYGISFKDKINHFEDDDGHDLFVPIKQID